MNPGGHVSKGGQVAGTPEENWDNVELEAQPDVDEHVAVGHLQGGGGGSVCDS